MVFAGRLLLWLDDRFGNLLLCTGSHWLLGAGTTGCRELEPLQLRLRISFGGLVGHRCEVLKIEL